MASIGEAYHKGVPIIWENLESPLIKAPENGWEKEDFLRLPSRDFQGV